MAAVRGARRYVVTVRTRAFTLSKASCGSPPFSFLLSFFPPFPPSFSLCPPSFCLRPSPSLPCSLSSLPPFPRLSPSAPPPPSFSHPSSAAPPHWHNRTHSVKIDLCICSRSYHVKSKKQTRDMESKGTQEKRRRGGPASHPKCWGLCRPGSNGALNDVLHSPAG